MIKKRLVIIFLLMISLLSTTAIAWCTDSDGGLDYLVKGWAEDDYSGKLWDHCLGYGIGDQALGEYYCNPYIVLQAYYECTSEGELWGCYDGKCIYGGCDETDDGENYGLKGTVSNQFSYWDRTDYCVDDVVLKEYACGDGDIDEFLKNCSDYGSGVGCTDGKCEIEYYGLYWDEHIISTSANGAYSVYAIDVDSDGDIDVLSASYVDDEITWYENDNQSFTEHVITATANGAHSVFAIDINNDTYIDILSASHSDDRIVWYENDGNENFTEHTISSTADYASSVYAIDVDGDNDIDVLSASYQDSKVAWYENDGYGNFITHNIDTSANWAKSVFAIDVDNDGDIDVLSANFGYNDIDWYENDGNENFTKKNVGSMWNALSVYAIDVDGDNDTDVLATGGGDDVAWYENNGDEYFYRHYIDRYIDGPQSVFAIDIDDDGDIDVLSASSGDDRITWYENDGNENFILKHVISSSANGAWSVFAIDVDGDNDTDILSASYGDDKIAWYENNPVLCSDTDGIDFNITGFMSSRGLYYPGNYTDICESVITGNLSYTTVIEYYCTDNDGDGEIFECQNYGAEWDCWQGHCSNNVTANCTDSDGINYYTTGYTSDKADNYIDYCYGDWVGNYSDERVLEYWCEGGVGWVTGDLFDCASYGPDWFCNEGKCEHIVTNCTDTDGGFIPTTKGTTTDDIGVFVDYCKYNDTGNYSDHRIREYYCEDGQAQGSWIDCKTFGSEYVCYDGECTSGNQRPLLFSVTSYGNETGYPEGRHHTAYSHNQRIWWEVDAVDLESDNIYVARDCDVEGGEPFVSDWGPANQLNTKFFNCTYDIGNYTAKIYVTDAYEGDWGDYSIYLTDELIIVECLTYDDCDEGYLCSEYGDCYVPSNVTNCTDSDSGLDFNTSGYVTTPWDIIYDECYSSTVLRERICSPSAPSGYESVLFNCITYGSDWVCYEGQCDNTTDTIMVTMNVKDYDTDALISGITYTIVQNPSYTVVASGTVSSGLVQFSVELGYNYQIILSDDSSIYKRWYEPKWSPESTINAYVEKYCTGDCLFKEDFEYADSPFHHGWRGANYSTTYHSNYGFMLDLDLTQTTNDIYIEFEESTSDVQIITYQVLLIDETPAANNDVYIYLEDDTGGDIFIMRYLVDSNEIGQIYYFDTEWRHALISQDIDLETPITTRLVYNDGVIDIYLDVLSDGNEVLYSENNPVIHTYLLEQLRIDPDPPTYDRSIYIDNIEITQSAVEPQEVEPGSPTSPSEADLDSPWYRDDAGDLKFDASKCEGWKSMLMCAGWKYTIGKIALGVAWIFTGIHILYFIVILLIIIIVGPLIVEWRKKR